MIKNKLLREWINTNYPLMQNDENNLCELDFHDMDKFADYLQNKVKESDSQHNVIKWVACADELPPKGKEVLVWMDDVKDYDLDKREYYNNHAFGADYSYWAEIKPPCL